MVTLTIDGRTVSVPEGTTILEAAQTLRISIPTLCYLKDINEIGACRICMVEVEGYARLVPSCDSAVSEGMVVYTSSPRVREARRVNLRLLLSQHETKCTKCTRSGNCKLQQLTNDYNLLGDHYIDDLKNIPTDYSNPVVRIENRCVKCMRCIQVCEKIQGMGIWDLMGTGTRTTVGVAHTRTLGESDCTFCGQCITHCPVGGLQEHDDTGKVFDALANKDRITVVQVAPAVRAAWAEFYHLDPKFATAERMVTALKTMGFDYVFDTDFAADLTIMEEGSEFIERFTHRNKYHWPMFTSCCPGWVRFLKGQFPSYTENLSTAKSPQQMFGAVAKSYFAQKIGVDPKKLFVVSIMPCTAKKMEAARPEFTQEGRPDVDLVITTRELVDMIRETGIHLDELELDWAQDRSPKGAREDDKMVIAIFLVPAIRKLALPTSEDFCDVLQKEWVRRYPKAPFYLGSYEEISTGFRKKILGLCFITTAVCEEEGKPDDCEELTAFRAFRDGYLKSCPDGEALIREYYDIAPGIVTCINLGSERRETYRAIRETWLAPCYEDLQNGRLAQCKDRYVDMVRTLEHRFLS